MGDGSQDFRCFFRAGRRIVRAGPFGTFGLTKVHADNLSFRFKGSCHGMISSVLSINGKYKSPSWCANNFTEGTSVAWSNRLIIFVKEVEKVS